MKEYAKGNTVLFTMMTIIICIDIYYIQISSNREGRLLKYGTTIFKYEICHNHVA